ncbi:hypothetical protein CQP30_01580 [Yersinia pestis]|uniref:Transposase n=2 Tax=Yersinia pseudotuberculosis complex TaxID=1649845 RepID=A0ABN5RCM4_YERPU|nr:hypothetical protein CEQ20_05730 [Yersinia pseudotuberculosis]AYW85572.1 hypothetical protein EGX42_05660 [Yersinia pestis]EIQ90468.1 hypothetical protein YPPY03_2582 [Yersinia pestis PY-03]EIR03312.1 hypothetical protein YPPY05_2533 [Yersinia pestis PY-05]EIR17272.1 hypothetical protein YPPY07_2459 [Yersinia pestis PY-07]EIR18145.1 hypothetical protein YPPY08_2573 [Yersinia pestis PY-08]EIR46054.1 hypothetical protein YPPY13_2582 [Yersinia pestis PY-13]EIR59817.1 hypothetical protein YPP
MYTARIYRIQQGEGIRSKSLLSLIINLNARLVGRICRNLRKISKEHGLHIASDELTQHDER